ncbi:MAG: chromosomal replication initiator protein DnaA [Candidatus Kapabacteria bacterium]|nr:chromosomal replication initiator protein DnaA [Candidatus Kapabacteria bacterium]
MVAVKSTEFSENDFDIKVPFISAENHENGSQVRSVAGAYWDKCLKIIQDNVSSQVFKTWFNPLKPLNWENNKLTLSVPSQFFFEWIEEHYYDLMRKTLSQVLGENASLEYRIVFDDLDDRSHSKSVKMPGFRYNPKPTQNTLPFEPVILSQKEFPTYLNPKYTLENFITGESNQLASSAAIAISLNPGKTKFNPLVIYGDTGLGKTHLVQGIGNYVSKNFPRLRVLYTDSERFTLEFVNAIQHNKVSEFSKFYRSIDVLIVDDIQFFSGKDKTQDNFFHTFNTLYQAGKQIILTSDKPPRDLVNVDDRLISRFHWGLITDIKAPDFEMRMAILQKKSSDEGIELTSDVTEYLARHIKTSIRDLEGALIGLIARVTFDKKPMSVELAKEVVYGSSQESNQPLTIENIKQIVSNYYQISTETIASKSRKHEIALARQMAIYLSKLLTNSSLKTIGGEFGGRDHSTVLHSCQTIENYFVTDKKVKASYETLLNQLKNK